jgi:carbon monoxide dehydrogenase subunit G
MIEVVAERTVAAAPESVWPLVSEPELLPRRLAWRHLAERLNGKPAPRFAASTNFGIDLIPEGGGTRVRLSSAQVPASRVKGFVMRAFGHRELERTLRTSLEALELQVKAG